VKVLVAVRQVVNLDDDFELSADCRTIDPDFIERDINEWDTFSLEEALLLKDETGAEVLVVTIGSEEAEEALLACLAKGADRAIRVWGDGVDTTDPLVTARVLAALVARESPDLILCGAQSSDTVNGATGAALAALVGLPCVAVVRGIELSGADSAIVERELEGGTVELVELSLPAVLTVQTGINEPRYATLRAIKQANEKPLGVLSLADVGVDPADLERFAGAKLHRLEVPQQEARAEMLEGDPATVAVRISEIVAERLG